MAKMTHISFDIEKKEFKKLRLWASSDDGYCGCPPGDFHEVEADDWRLISKTIRRMIEENA